MKSKNNMLLTSVINLDLWNKAGWRGVAFASNGESSPYMGLVFENREVAIEIFKEWLDRFGKKDIYDEIRVCIIEGEFDAEDYGYTVHINTNIDNMLSKCKENNLNPNSTLITTIGRFNHMNTQKNSRNLEGFKEEYHRYLSYYLFPVCIDGNHLEPLYDYAIEKTEILFREVKDILEDDFDAFCISRQAPR
ncbi:hypothetical protein [Clostridium perfringens]|uniref:hypothetical protein n=1 Tax=Clostridium perfringens TaxID=1502 RepID=UPI002A2D32AA|nr:hypothetical protein [Clostridium perfringens]MDM0881873.1 hypothetical protein [Clostridium perfringens]